MKNFFKGLDKQKIESVSAEKTIHADKTKIQVCTLWYRPVEKQDEKRTNETAHISPGITGNAKIFFAPIHL